MKTIDDLLNNYRCEEDNEELQELIENEKRHKQIINIKRRSFNEDDLDLNEIFNI